MVHQITVLGHQQAHCLLHKFDRIFFQSLGFWYVFANKRTPFIMFNKTLRVIITHTFSVNQCQGFTVTHLDNFLHSRGDNELVGRIAADLIHNGPMAFQYKLGLPHPWNWSERRWNLMQIYIQSWCNYQLGIHDKNVRISYHCSIQKHWRLLTFIFKAVFAPSDELTITDFNSLALGRFQ